MFRITNEMCPLKFAGMRILTISEDEKINGLENWMINFGNNDIRKVPVSPRGYFCTTILQAMYRSAMFYSAFDIDQGYIVKMLLDYNKRGLAMPASPDMLIYLMDKLRKKASDTCTINDNAVYGATGTDACLKDCMDSVKKTRSTGVTNNIYANNHMYSIFYDTCFKDLLNFMSSRCISYCSKVEGSDNSFWLYIYKNMRVTEVFMIRVDRGSYTPSKFWYDIDHVRLVNNGGVFSTLHDAIVNDVVAYILMLVSKQDYSIAADTIMDYFYVVQKILSALTKEEMKQYDQHKFNLAKYIVNAFAAYDLELHTCATDVLDTLITYQKNICGGDKVTLYSYMNTYLKNQYYASTRFYIYEFSKDLMDKYGYDSKTHDGYILGYAMHKPNRDQFNQNFLASDMTFFNPSKGESKRLHIYPSMHKVREALTSMYAEAEKLNSQGFFDVENDMGVNKKPKSHYYWVLHYIQKWWTNKSLDEFLENMSGSIYIS